MQLDLDRDNGKYLSPDADKSVRNLYTFHRYNLKNEVLALAGYLFDLIGDLFPFFRRAPPPPTLPALLSRAAGHDILL